MLFDLVTVDSNFELRSLEISTKSLLTAAVENFSNVTGGNENA